MTDQFHHWRDRLAGKSVSIHIDTPQSGIYVYRRGKGAPIEPVWIWQDDAGAFHASIGKSQRIDPCVVWNSAGANPCSKADAEYWLEHKRFPGEIEEPAGIGDNSGDVSLKQRLLDYIETARAWISKAKVVDQTSCDMAANYASELTTLKNRLDNERKAKVQPHLDAQRDINGEYNPAIKEADDLAKQIKRATDGYLIAEKRRLEDEARLKYEAELAAAREAQRKAAEEAAKNAEPERPPIPVEPVKVPMPPAPVKVQAGGQKGKKMALRTYVSFEVENYTKALEWSATNAEVVAAVEKVCKAACRDGIDVPGMKKIVEERAA